MKNPVFRYLLLLFNIMDLYFEIFSFSFNFIIVDYLMRINRIEKETNEEIIKELEKINGLTCKTYLPTCMAALKSRRGNSGKGKSKPSDIRESRNHEVGQNVIIPCAEEKRLSVPLLVRFFETLKTINQKDSP